MCLPYLFILCLERRVEVSQLVSGGKIQLLLRNGSCLLAATGLVCSHNNLWCWVLRSRPLHHLFPLPSTLEAAGTSSGWLL
jgi:hypothetical protein